MAYHISQSFQKSINYRVLMEPIFGSASNTSLVVENSFLSYFSPTMAALMAINGTHLALDLLANFACFFFLENLSGIPSYMSNSLDPVQTVCNGYQQRTLK